MKNEKKACPDCNGGRVYQEYDEYDRYYVHSCATCKGLGEIVRQSATSEEVQQPETSIHLTNEQIDRLVECAVDLMKTLYPLIEDVLKIVKHYFDDIEDGEVGKAGK